MARSPKDTNPSAPGVQHSEGVAFRPLVFGEALFDHFPDGSKVLGGAPFNVAWHLRGFKADPLFITSIGEDADGDSILGKMKEWGLDLAGVQRHPTRPTGRVSALIEDGEPRYVIEKEQAYDFVTVEGLPQASRVLETHLLYHGSLALREPTSAETLKSLRKQATSPVLVDVNLRAPWWERETVRGFLHGVDWVKMNREEAGLLCGIPIQTEEELDGAAAKLRNELGIENLVVTLGSEGSKAFGPQGPLRQGIEGGDVSGDTVGAGDAFSAVLAMAIHGRWSMETALGRATRFAAEICGIKGAIPQDPALYARHLRRWNDAS